MVGPNSSSTDRKFSLVPVTNSDDDIIKFMITTSGQVCVTGALDFELKTLHQFHVVVDNTTLPNGTIHSFNMYTITEVSVLYFMMNKIIIGKI